MIHPLIHAAIRVHTSVVNITLFTNLITLQIIVKFYDFTYPCNNSETIRAPLQLCKRLERLRNMLGLVLIAVSCLLEISLYDEHGPASQCTHCS